MDVEFEFCISALNVGYLLTGCIMLSSGITGSAIWLPTMYLGMVGQLAWSLDEFIVQNYQGYRVLSFCAREHGFC